MNKNSIVILLFCALFLFFKYIAQLFPSLISSELISTGGFDAMMMAIMASSYYYSYTVMQVIAGFIVDRYWVRVPMILAFLLISLMMIVFASTDNFYLMCVSRAMMGVGASFATVLYMKCAAYYTDAKLFGLISSMLATATMLGAACGSLPIGVMFQCLGWKFSLTIIAAVGIAMSVLVVAVRFDQPAKFNFQKGITNNFFKSFREVVKQKNNWLLLAYSGLTFSPVAILGGLWGVPFLMEKHGVTIVNASMLLSIMFVGHAVGSPVWAFVAAMYKCKKTLMNCANIISFIAIILIVYASVSYSVVIFLFFIFGFSVGCFMLSFDLCRGFNSVALMGLSVAFVNSGEGIVSSFFEPVIGYALDHLKSGSYFSLHDYQLALLVLPLSFVLSSIVLSFVKVKQEDLELELCTELT